MSRAKRESGRAGFGRLPLDFMLRLQPFLFSSVAPVPQPARFVTESKIGENPRVIPFEVLGCGLPNE